MNQVCFPDGPFGPADLERAGISRAALRAAVRNGAVRRVLTGVYVAASVPDTMDLRTRVVSSVVRPGHVVCDRTAAWLHGVDCFTYAERAILPQVETCALRGENPTDRNDVRGLTRDLSMCDVMSLDDLRVTTPLRTAIDLGCHLSRKDALAALDGLRAGHGLTLGQLQGELPRFRGRRGVVQLRELVPLSDPRSESVRESWLRLAIHDAGLPAPEPQWWVDDVVRLDLAYPSHRTAVEYDGAEFHDRTDAQRDHDRRRRAWLAQRGWTVIVVRNGDFTGPALDRWLRELRSALLERRSNLRWG